MYQIITVIALLFIKALLSSSSFSTDWSAEFDHYTYLDEYELFRLYWNNLENDMIEFGMEAAATGWIALGISPNGQMPGSDIAIGWVDGDGNVYLQDRYTTGRTTPLYDPNQNLTLIEGEEVDGMTRIRFMRAKYTCNENDIQLAQGTTRLIWAFHETADPEQECFDSDSIKFHTNKGAQSLNLNAGIQQPVELESDTKYMDILFDDVAVPAIDTTYWCKIIKIPELPTTHHVVKFEQIITDGNEGIVHHLLAYECDEWLIRDENDLNVEGHCIVAFENMPAAECRNSNLVYAWGIGGEDLYFPEEAGLPIGGDSGFKYIMMEMHYDNPEERSDIIDSSGYRMYYTAQLRENDAGILRPGSWENMAGQLIPPGLPYGHSRAFMYPECTEELFPEDGIKIFANILHQHTIGVAVNFRIVRDGQELEPIDSNWNYDFNYQQFVILEPERMVLPGDTLILDCYTDSTERDSWTVGGAQSWKEMCITFFMYYPAVDAKGSYSAKMAEYGSYGLGKWIEDAYNAGYINGDPENALVTGDLDLMTWNVSKEGAAEFYNRLWDPSYPQYDSHSFSCHSDDNTTGYYDEGIPQPGNFIPYIADIFECEYDYTNGDEGICISDGPDLPASPVDSKAISLFGNMQMIALILGVLGFIIN